MEWVFALLTGVGAGLAVGVWVGYRTGAAFLGTALAEIGRAIDAATLAVRFPGANMQVTQPAEQPDAAAMFDDLGVDRPVAPAWMSEDD